MNNEGNSIELTTTYGDKNKKNDKPYVQDIPDDVLKLFGVEVKKNEKK